jgi:hypothetical protein
MKVEHKSKPITLMLRAKTAADKKRIAEAEEALSRQVGWPVKFNFFTDAGKNEYAVVGWIAKRQDQAAIAMFLRRGKLATDTAKGKELLAVDDVHENIPALVTRQKGLSRKLIKE